MSSNDVLIAGIDKELNRTDALRHSILKNAFSGQLVAQDSNDEPASILLERIKAEKELNGTNKREPKKPKSQGPAA